MSYRTLHKANERYELAVMWLLIGAFVLAMALMFVHPTGAILVFLLGLIILAVASIIELVVKRIERSAARTELTHHHCPACGEYIKRSSSGNSLGEWHCEKCSANFLDSGDEGIEVE